MSHARTGTFSSVPLTYHQIEFPKTHQIHRLLTLPNSVSPVAAEALSATKWLGPFGVEARYPGDAVEMLAGDDAKAIEMAILTRETVRRILSLR